MRSSARRTSVVSFVLDGLVLVEELLIGLVLLLRLDAALLELDRQLVDLLDLVERTDAGSVDGAAATSGTTSAVVGGTFGTLVSVELLSTAEARAEHPSVPMRLRLRSNDTTFVLCWHLRDIPHEAAAG